MSYLSSPKTWHDRHSLVRLWTAAMGNKPKSPLKIVRERAGLTQEKAARALGMSVSAYRKKEQGSRGMNADFIKRAAEQFGVNPDQIISELAEPGSPVAVPLDEIDQEKLATLVAQAKPLITVLSEADARHLVLALITASRIQRDPPKS